MNDKPVLFKTEVGDPSRVATLQALAARVGARKEDWLMGDLEEAMRIEMVLALQSYILQYKDVIFDENRDHNLNTATFVLIELTNQPLPKDFWFKTTIRTLCWMVVEPTQMDDILHYYESFWKVQQAREQDYADLLIEVLVLRQQQHR